MYGMTFLVLRRYGMAFLGLKGTVTAQKLPKLTRLVVSRQKQKEPPTRATSLMPTGKVVTTVRQARVNLTKSGLTTRETQ